MQTNFTAEQLADPHVAEAESILRKCVHCGFCTATCPTYVTLGNELDSPRGRIYLIKDMLENGRPADEQIVTHIDRCLSCLACTTTCPSGVDYMHLVDHARTHIEKTYRRPLMNRLTRDMLAMVLPYPGRFRWTHELAALGRPFAGLLDQVKSLKPMAAMLRLSPSKVAPPSDFAKPATHAATAARRGRVAILTGCAQPVLDPGINEAAISLLTRLGVEVVVRPWRRAAVARSSTIWAARNRRSTAPAAMSTSGPVPSKRAVSMRSSSRPRAAAPPIKDYGAMLRQRPRLCRRRPARVASASEGRHRISCSTLDLADLVRPRVH